MKMKIIRSDEDYIRLYVQIERLIIDWSNDGTKTAGTLTRQIVKLFELNETHKKDIRKTKNKKS